MCGALCSNRYSYCSLRTLATVMDQQQAQDGDQKVEVAVDQVSDDSTALKDLAMADDVEGARRLLADGHFDINAQLGGMTVLHTALAVGASCELVSLLVSYGAKPNLKAQNTGGAALHWAARGGDPEIVDLLINKGASPTLKNNRGETPIDLATRFGQESVVAQLKSAAEGSVNADIDRVRLEVQAVNSTGGNRHSNRFTAKQQQRKRLGVTMRQ